MASLFHAQDVSIAIGTNVRVVVISMHLVVFKVVACFTAAPASTAVSLRWNSTNVSGNVTSHASGFPCDHGMSMAPSDRFASVQDCHTGSSTTIISACLMALHITLSS